MSVSIKASLYKDSWQGTPTEIRRFTVDELTARSYESLLEQVAKTFPTVTTENVTLAWIDEDGDTIVISSDDELAQALEHFKGNLFRLYLKRVSVPGEQPDSAGSINAGRSEQKGSYHPGVVCDGCNQGIHGSRYKCLNCSDYDLCSSCESKGIHTNHNMVEIEHPFQFGPFGRGFFGGPSACPAGRWARGPWHCGPLAGSCGRQWGSRGRCGGGGGSGRPWFTGQGRQCRPDATSKPAEGKPAESESMDTTEQKQGPSEEDQRQYLQRMGNAVSSFLEPLGIKVDVDVVGGKDKQGASGASGSDAATVKEDDIQIALAQLKSMGYEDEGGWLTELIRAKEGDVSKVLDALHPSADEPEAKV